MAIRAPRTLLLALIPLLASTTAAQTVGKSQIIGWTHTGTTSEVHIQDIDNNCTPAKSLFKALGAPFTFWGGGTAYDPRHESLWISDGNDIVEVRISDGTTLCKFNAQTMNRSAVVSGLAIARKKGLLIQLETTASYAGLRSYSLKTCPPTPLRDGCSVTLPTGYYSGGLAYDEVEDLVYYTVTRPGFQVPYNEVWVASDKSRCIVLCKQSVPGCIHFFGTDATGLAYNPCNKTLYMTVGGGTVPIGVGDPRKCEFKGSTCCVKQTAGVFKGLAIVPGWESFKKGSSCITKGCPNCSNLGLDLVGTPALGNGDFGVQINNGPTGAVSAIGIGLMTCGKGTHFLCGAVWLPGGFLVAFPGQLTGPQCAASVTLPLPLPVEPKLCGLKFCLQGLIDCGSGSGFGLTEAIQFSVTG